MTDKERIKQMSEAMTRLAKTMSSEMGIPATQFAKAARALAKFMPPIPLDNSLRGRFRRKWNAIREGWELEVTYTLYLIFLSLTILGGIWFLMTILQML